MSTPSRAGGIAPSRFIIAVHSLVWLALCDGLCPSSEIAAQVLVHATFLRRVMSPLVQAGIVVSREGRVGGYALARPAERITLADVYAAVKTGPAESTEDTERNPSCGPRGQRLNAVLKTMLDRAEQQAVHFLNGVTIADLTKHVGEEHRGAT